ncbi:MAG: hypothetical protein ACREJC_01080, partial [Tepidisphaeraceae bacterium]
MKLHVTADDIVHGTRTACMHCPIARAYTRQTGHRCWVEIEGDGPTSEGAGSIWDVAEKKRRELPRLVIAIVSHY